MRKITALLLLFVFCANIYTAIVYADGNSPLPSSDELGDSIPEYIELYFPSEAGIRLSDIIDLNEDASASSRPDESESILPGTIISETIDETPEENTDFILEDSVELIPDDVSETLTIPLETDLSEETDQTTPPDSTLNFVINTHISRFSPTVSSFVITVEVVQNDLPIL